MGANLSQTNDNDDVQLKGGTDSTLIGNVSDALKTSAAHADTAPVAQNITTFDTVTASLVGANGQIFYTGNPTTNSTASFSLSAIDSVSVQSVLIGVGGTMVIETSMDGGTFWTRPVVFQQGTQSYSNSFTAPFVATVNTAGMTNIRVRGTVSWTGTASISVRESVNPRSITIADSLPPGGNAIGTVSVTSSALPTGASTAANQTTLIASIQILDDVPTAPNAVIVKGSPVMGQLDDTSTVVATEDNASVVRITAQRAMHANLRNTAGTEIGTSGTPVRTDPTGTTNQPVTDIFTTSGQYRAQSVTTSAAEALGAASILAVRKSISILPTNGTVYWGYSNAVTTSTGSPIFKNQLLSIPASATVHVYLIAGGTVDCRISEAG